MEITNEPATAAFITIYKWGEHTSITINPSSSQNPRNKTS